MVIVNFWLLLSPEAATALGGAARVSAASSSGEPAPMPAVVTSQQFPRANALSPETLKMVRNYPERHRAGIGMPTGLWNCYASGSGYHSFVVMREDLQGIEEAYPGHFQVAGCWDYTTGAPIGGVGSPWFVTPEGFDVRRDIVLGAGQAKRNFV